MKKYSCIEDLSNTEIN